MAAKTSHIVHCLTPVTSSLTQKLLTDLPKRSKKPSTYLGSVPGKAYFEQFLAKPHVIALVALAGEAFVGGLVAYALEKLEQERSETYIYDLAVAATHRRKGTATALICGVQKIAAACSAHVIFVQADQGDGPVTTFYASLACAKRCLTSMSNSLPTKASR